MNRYFYAVQFKSGRNTTTGQPNPRTFRMSRAVDIEIFTTKAARDDWVDAGEITSDMSGNCREVVTKKELRDLCLGMSVQEFDEYIEILQHCVNYEIR